MLEPASVGARVDLGMFIDPDVSPRAVPLQQIVPREVDWRRNPPSTADTLDVVIAASYLPFDFDVLRGMHIQCWLYTHDTPERCQIGDPGYFAGIVDKPERSRGDDSIRLPCRDFTALLLKHQLTAKDLRSISFEAFPRLYLLVERLVRFMPGGEAWVVKAVDETARTDLLEAFGRVKRERVSVVGNQSALDAQAQRLSKRRREIEAAERDARADVMRRTRPPTLVGGVMAFYSHEPVHPQTERRPATASGPVVAPETITITRTSRTLRFTDIWPNSDISLWDAIMTVCGLVGVVPEVALDPQDGAKQILLVDAAQLHTEGALRPFTRDGRRHRRLTMGRRITELKDAKALTTDQRLPDFVDVATVSRETMGLATARWPAYTDAQIRRGKLEGLRQSVHNVPPGALLGLAQRAFTALRSGALTVDLTTMLPWTDGGGPTDPDLLDMGTGAALELAVAGIDALDATPSQALVAQGFPRQSAELIAEALVRSRPPLVFQVHEVQHRLGTSGYSCEIGLRRFLASTGGVT